MNENNYDKTQNQNQQEHIDIIEKGSQISEPPIIIDANQNQ